MNVLVTGGSHVVALNQGFRQMQESGEIPDSMQFHLRPLGGGLSISGEFFRARDDHVEITNPKFRAKFERIPPPGASCDVIALSTALYSRPVWNKADWGVYGVPGISKGRIPASDSMLRRAIRDDNKYLIEFLKHLRDLGITACVIEGPRPFRHNIEVERAGVDLVRHIDALYRSLTLQVLEQERIAVIPVPETVYDADGFMLERYRSKNAKDKTHGNAEFGRLMMSRVVEFVRRLAEGTSPGVERRN